MNNGMPWIKSYTRKLDDIRLCRISETSQLAYFKLELLAARCDADGAFVQNNEQLTENEIAFYIRMDPKQFKKSLREMIANNLVHVNGRGPQITDFADEQVSQATRREAWQARQDRHRTVTSDAEPVTRDSTVTHAPRVRTRIKNQSKSKNQNQSKSNTNQPTPTPSRNERSTSGRVAGKKVKADRAVDDLTLKDLKGQQRKRADLAMKLLGSSGIRNPKLETTSILLATRHFKTNEDLTVYVIAAIASVFADTGVKSKEAVIIHRIETDKVPQSFVESPSLWRSVPIKVLEAAGIDDLDRYVNKNKYVDPKLQALRSRGQ